MLGHGLEGPEPKHLGFSLCSAPSLLLELQSLPGLICVTHGKPEPLLPPHFLLFIMSDRHASVLRVL